jgi:GNAT superfamily N-acetyltransferase
MVLKSAEFSTKELTSLTLKDFEKLFESRPAPGAFTCWCMYHHRPKTRNEPHKRYSNAEIALNNRLYKRRLVENGLSHGIIVYEEGDPIGWCQFGPMEELPRVESNNTYRRINHQQSKNLWRITCFTVKTKYRNRGVASVGLEAALRAIERRGGGLVEAYPIRRRGAYREYLGTIAMFKKQGFKVVAPFGESNVIVQKFLPS